MHEKSHLVASLFVISETLLYFASKGLQLPHFIEQES